MTVADVLLRRHLRDIWLWRELRTRWAAIWEAEYPSGMEVVTSEYIDTGWEVGMAWVGGGGTWVSSASSHCWTLDRGEDWGGPGIREPVEVDEDEERR